MTLLQIRQSILCALLILFPLALQAAVTTQVDRTNLYQGEKLTLTLKIDSKVDQRPNLNALEPDFRVLGSKKTTLSSHSTGVVTTSTQWLFKLRAMSEGRLEIPPINIGSEYSSATFINVMPSELNPAPEETGLQQFFIELEVDKDELYVNSQAILIVRITHLTPLPLDSQLSRPNVRNAIIKELEYKKESKTEINGQDYFVTEYSYTLFPRAEGTVEVEPFFFNTTLGNGEILDLSSSLLLLKVLPKAFTNNRDLWLPARSVYIEDNLTEVSEVEKGGSLVRIITLEAEGLPSSSLPLLTDMINTDAEIKLTNVVLEEQVTEQGITSRRMEELEIFPTSGTDVTLPAIDLPWWSTDAERTQNASIPARMIKINAMPATAEQAVVMKTSSESSFNTGNLLIWLLTAITIAATLGCIYAFYFLRKSKALTPPKDEPTAHEKAIQQLATDVAERNAFKALAQACEQSNPQQARIRLIEWGQLFFRNMELSTSKQVCDLAGNGTLTFLVTDMEDYLTSNPHLWHGDLLVEEVEKVRNRRKRQETDNYGPLSYQS
ncbi:BatD family protein [Neptuniibacter sp.]|uniref:BatD family protein n=1 Tax=Neptuniibacter sp. TaxID=1962643 RepID=UPI003B5B9DC8